jgi:hypothetical protein
MLPSPADGGELQAAIAKASAPVFINVYELGHGALVRSINAVSRDVLSQGGIFHIGVEIYGKEWSFGATLSSMSGVFPCLPRLCSMHSYRETVYLGDCAKSEDEVRSIVRGIRPQWSGNSYNWLHKNCTHFASEFCDLLGIGELPRWTHKLADVGAKVDTLTQGWVMPSEPGAATPARRGAVGA